MWTERLSDKDVANSQDSKGGRRRDDVELARAACQLLLTGAA